MKTQKKDLWIHIVLLAALIGATAFTVLDVFFLQHTTGVYEDWSLNKTESSAFGTEAPGETESVGSAETGETFADSSEAGSSDETKDATASGSMSDAEPENTETEDPESSTAESGATEAEETETAKVTRPEPDYHYSDGKILIDIRVADYANERGQKTRYYVADVRLASAEYLHTALANNATELIYNNRQRAREIGDAHGALFCVNGDGCGQVRDKGYVVRNAVLLRTRQHLSRTKTEDLVIFSDGAVGWFDEREVSIEALRDMRSPGGGTVEDVFSFGPVLIKDGEISVALKEEISGYESSDPVNPRTAFGWVNNLHYVFLVADGRTAEAHGLTLYQCAEILKDYGCQIAYNFDGGGSSTMVFQGQVINRTINAGIIIERIVSDIVYIGY